MWCLTITIVSHYMHIKEDKFKGCIQNKELKQLWVRVLRKTRDMLDDDVL